MKIPKIEWKKSKNPRGRYNYYGLINNYILCKIEPKQKFSTKYCKLTFAFPTHKGGLLEQLNLSMYLDDYEFKSIKKCKEVAQSCLEDWLKEILGEYNARY